VACRRPTYTRKVTTLEPAPGFASLGHATARAVVERAALSGRIARTLLVQGPAGAGKGAFVDDLLALLFCTDPVPERRPCNACRGCRDARARQHPDLVIGSPDRWREGRSTGESIVASARRWLLETAGAPVASEHRVVLVEGADQANEQIQNALLKALEEPAPRQMFILVADEPTRLLPTIRSRSQPLRIGPVLRAALVDWLMDRERLPADQAQALARISGGLVGRAVTFAHNAPLIEWRRRTRLELLELLRRGRADRFGSARDLLDAAVKLGAAPPDDAPPADDEPVRTPASAQRQAALLIVDAWMALTRDLLLVAAGRPALAESAETSEGEGLEAASRLSQPALLGFVDHLERTREGLRQNAAPVLALEVAMLAWPNLPQTR
jgi:DNA polymerase III delta prime subunit